MKVGLIGSLIIWVAIAWIISGCSGSTGWNFGIGVYPVTGIDHHQTLKEKESVTDSESSKRR